MKYKIAIIALFISVLAPLWGAQTARAVSAYDNVVKDSGTMTINEIDHSTTWFSQLRTYADDNSDSALDAILDDVEETTNRALFYTTSSDLGCTYGCVQVFSYENDNAWEYFTNTRAMMGIKVSDVNGVLAWSYNAAGEITSYGGVSGSWGEVTRSDDSLQWYATDNYNVTAYSPKAVFVNGGIVYPSGYEGDTITETIEIITEVDYYPKFNYAVKDLEMTGVFCFDEREAICNVPDGYDGISWRIENSAEEVVFNSADDEVTEGFVNVRFDVYGDYMLYANWTTHPPLLPPEGTNVHELVLPIKIDGSSYASSTGEKHQNCDSTGTCETITAMETCVDTATWTVDFEGCGKNVNTFVNMLSFRTLSFGSYWTNVNECRTLGTVGDWLGLENKEVCAKMPSEVRSIVTPFVTFLLGLITITFLAKKVGGSYEG